MNANKKLMNQASSPEEKAISRYMLIAPLLNEDLDEAALVDLRYEISEKNGLSERTLRRYVNAYHESGFEGLKPAERVRYKKDSMPDNYEEILAAAIQLRREVPRRSVEQIILILEMEGLVAPGVLKRPTLQRHMYQAGFGAEHMEVYKEARSSSSKRYCKPHRMMLVQADIKYGPALPIGKDGKMVKTYLSSVIDDHSRMILSSEFYDNQEEGIVADTLHKAILKYGHFDKCYFDNGSQYVAKQLTTSLSRLSIRIAHAPIQSGKSKGKIEKFHQVVDDFLAEIKAKKVKTLEELNYYWKIYLEQYYNNKAHDGIKEYYLSLGVEIPKEGISPLQEFNRDTRPLTFLDAAVVGEAFLHHEIRKVDKGGCISFQGKLYETKTSLIGQKVEISYDPASKDTVIIRHPNTEPFEAVPVCISGYCNSEKTLTPSMQTPEPETSRFLDALEKQHKESSKKKADAISFGHYKKEVTN